MRIPFPAPGPKSRKQVAAVCYRVRRFKIEFLLVRTRKGRWTFPKGGVVAGLTHAQSAALEAFEEAGVHGRIEESSFTRYILRKRGNPESAEAAIHAYLCEVLRVGPPQEPNRSPTWFSPETSETRLCERRTFEDGRELSRVVDRAMARIQRVGSRNGASADPLRRVLFEASEVSFRRLIEPKPLLGVRGKARSPALPPVLEFDATSRKISRISPVPPGRWLPR